VVKPLEDFLFTILEAMELGQIDAAATTLVLRTSKKLTFRQLLSLLDRVCTLAQRRHAYDFVYMPWTKLAIVNFRSAETCEECFRAFGQCNESTLRFVGQAVVQGLHANLALFLSKSGVDSVNDPGAPRIFADDGREVEMHEAVRQFQVMEVARSKAQLAQPPTRLRRPCETGPCEPGYYTPTPQYSVPMDFRSYTSTMDEVPWICHSSTQSSEMSSEASRIVPNMNWHSEERSILEPHQVIPRQATQSQSLTFSPGSFTDPPRVTLRGQQLIFEL